MKKYFGILRKCSLFNNIEDEDLSALLICLSAKVEAFDKKQTVISAGTAAKYIGIVLSGSAQISHTDYFGNRSIIADVTSGEVFAEAFACAGLESIPITVTANEPCEIMLIDCGRIMHSCSNACDFHRQLIFNLMKTLAVKNIMFHQKIEITSKRSTREKLMAYLLFQAEKSGSNSFDIPFDRQELADYLEVDRSGLSTQIGKLCSEGIIRCRRRHFELI